MFQISCFTRSRSSFQKVLLLAISLAALNAGAEEHIRLAPGDDKTNYSRIDYKTDSLSLEQRTGTPANLLELALKQQLGLPKLVFPRNNLPDSRKISLGRKLFFDRRLSRNKTMSCAMCHVPEQGFTNNELARPIGFEGRGLKRNAPTLLNVAHYSRLFLDLREYSLEQQVWSPLLAANEMNNPSIGYVVETVIQAKDYTGLFEEAFGSLANMATIGMALAQYERALISGESRFDRWMYAKDKQALSSQELSGYQLFIGKAGCSSCHLIEKDHSIFSDNKAHNTGIGYRDSMLGMSKPIRVQLAPGISAQLEPEKLESVSNFKPNDLGLYEVTLNPKDRWKFRTPILRNVALTAPYMHNGELLSLEEVIEFYDRGGVPNELISPLIRPLNLSKSEKDSLVAFLKSLTGKNVKAIVSDAFSVPIGDPSTDH